MSATEPLLGRKRGDYDDADAIISVTDQTPSPIASGYQSINAIEADSVMVTSISSEAGVTTGEETHVYKRRWYILILFSLVAGTQGGVWNTFGPISSTAEEAFSWDTSTISLLTNWGPISFFVATAPLIWTLERKGLRAACLLMAFFIASGTVARVFTMDAPAVTILMNLGQALNGLAGPIAMAGPPALSAVWFPPSQRTTATSIGTFFGMTGTAAGFLLGPMMVPDVPGNASTPSDDFQLSFTHHNESKAQRVETEKAAIRRLMYIECGWACGLFLLMLIYFPSKPPLPPSPSAALQREDFVQGLKTVFSCPQFWVLAAVYGLSQGVLNCWASVIDVILKPHNISETQAGWIGFIATCGGSVTSIFIGVLADYMKRMMKWIVLLFYIAGTAAFLVFTLAVNNYIPSSTALFMATVIGGTTAVYAATPLLFEVVCEAVYPAGEGTANGVLTLINNIVGGVFLLLLMIPSLGTTWVNWVLVGACAQAIPLMLMLRMRYNRLDLDEHNPHLSATVIVQAPASPPHLSF